MSATVRLHTKRPVMVEGRRVEAGARLEVTPLQAADLLEGAPDKVELVDRADLAACVAARRQHTAGLLRRVPTPPADYPWQPLQ